MNVKKKTYERSTFYDMNIWILLIWDVNVFFD